MRSEVVRNGYGLREVEVVPALGQRSNACTGAEKTVPERAGGAGLLVPVVVLAFGLLGAVALGIFLLFRGRNGAPCPGPHFTSIEENELISKNSERHSKIIDVSRIRTFSFLVRNAGPNPVVVQPELSPDGINWSSFGELAYLLNPGEKHLFAPQLFLRYSRIKYRNKIPGRDTVLTVWFQGQG
ncbi:DUF6385 domain-containing protein [Desulfotomaculum copahuensis]|nr:DUF6385 domain-containing protein [Desulfotomaculum copahuensis]